MVGIYVISVASIIWILLIAAVYRTWLAGTCVTGVLLLGVLLVEAKNIIFDAPAGIDLLYLPVAISVVVLIGLFLIEWPVRNTTPEHQDGFPYLPDLRGGFRRELMIFTSTVSAGLFFSGRLYQAMSTRNGQDSGCMAMYYLEFTFATIAWVVATTFFIRLVAVAHERYSSPGVTDRDEAGLQGSAPAASSHSSVPYIPKGRQPEHGPDALPRTCLDLQPEGQDLSCGEKDRMDEPSC